MRIAIGSDHAGFQYKELLRAMLAAHNCGLDNVLRAARHGLDLDFYTAGRDYARDILNRAGFFEAHGWD